MSVLLDSASTALMKIYLQQRRGFRVYVRRAPSRKFETLSSFAKEISPTGEGVNHVVKRGEVQIVQSFDTRLHATQDDRPFDTRFALLKDEPFPE